MHIAYLGEPTMDSYIVDCLIDSCEFVRVDHFTKPTLELTHIHMNPQPDVIVLKCDCDNKELEWAKRYAVDIPKIFVVCDMCTHKFVSYLKLGSVYYLDAALHERDMELESLIKLIKETT